MTDKKSLKVVPKDAKRVKLGPKMNPIELPAICGTADKLTTEIVKVSDLAKDGFKLMMRLESTLPSYYAMVEVDAVELSKAVVHFNDEDLVEVIKKYGPPETNFKYAHIVQVPNRKI